MHEAVLIGKDHGLHAVPQMQLREKASDVRLHGGLCDDKCVGNLCVRPALRKRVEHLQRGLLGLRSLLCAHTPCELGGMFWLSAKTFSGS